MTYFYFLLDKLINILIHFISEVSIISPIIHWFMNNQKDPLDKKLTLSNLPDLLTVREVADLLRVSPLTIKRWGKRGKLPAIRINSRGDRRYRKEQVLWLLGIQEKKD